MILNIHWDNCMFSTYADDQSTNTECACNEDITKRVNIFKDNFFNGNKGRF